MPRPAQPLMHTIQTAQREPGPQCRPGTAGAAALTWTPRKRLGARCTVCTAGCVPNAVNSAPYLQLHAAASSGAPSSRSHCVGAGEHASPALWRPSRVETKESRRLLRANSILAVGTLPTPTNAARPPAADKIGGHKEARLSYQLLHRHIIFMIGPPSGQHQEGVARTGRRETRGHTVACGRSNCEQAPLRQLRGVVRGPMQTAMISAASRQHLRCVPGQAKLLLRGPAAVVSTCRASPFCRGPQDSPSSPNNHPLSARAASLGARTATGRRGFTTPLSPICCSCSGHRHWVTLVFEGTDSGAPRCPAPQSPAATGPGGGQGQRLVCQAASAICCHASTWLRPTPADPTGAALAPAWRRRFRTAVRRSDDTNGYLQAAIQAHTWFAAGSRFQRCQNLPEEAVAGTTRSLGKAFHAASQQYSHI